MPQQIIIQPEHCVVVGVSFDDVLVAQDAVGVETVLGDPVPDLVEDCLVVGRGLSEGEGGEGDEGEEEFHIDYVVGGE